MLGLDEIRKYAMSLPGVVEGPPVRAARRIAAFKVGGVSFLGVDKGERTITLSLGQEEAKGLIENDPAPFEQIWRREKIFAGLRVDLMNVSAKQVKSLIERAWLHRAPKSLVASYHRRK